MRVRYLAVLLVLGAIWGASFLFIKVGVAEIPPASLVAVRLVVGAALLLVVLYASGARLPASRRGWIDLFVLGALGVVAPFLLITWAEQSIPSGLTAILNATTPLFTALLTYVWTRAERLRGGRLLGVGLGFAGVVLAVGLDNLDLSSAGTQGKLAVLLAAVCYAITAIYARQAFRGAPPLVPAAGQIFAGAVLIIPIALVIDGAPRAVPSFWPLAAVLALAVFGTAVAYIMFYWLLERLGATRTSMVTYLTPPVALVYGALLLNEPIAANTLIGLGLVIGGIALANGVIRPRPAAARLAPRERNA
jgi:drug/metabolite transporter (DMT)-like permease